MSFSLQKCINDKKMRIFEKNLILKKKCTCTANEFFLHPVEAILKCKKINFVKKCTSPAYEM